MTALFASVPYGLEELLKAELEALGAQQCRIAAGGVHYLADSAVMYRSLLCSRLASRVLLPLVNTEIHSDLDLYLAAQAQSWPEIFADNASFMVQFHGTNADIRHSQYGALRIKDAIVDSFNNKNLPRPTVDRERPALVINGWLHKNALSLALDLSGGSLHQRGYRQQAGAAPLKENLAAAIVARSGWQPGTPLIDPLCGSGTLLIEAAMLACDIAPGLRRSHWGFYGWRGHDESGWQTEKQAAAQRATDGLARYPGRFYGYDQDERVIDMAKANARRAGVAEVMQFAAQALAQLRNPSPEASGTLISNPPYGERLASEPSLMALHSQLGRVLKREFSGWRLSLFSASAELLSCLQLRAGRQFKAKNGALDCVQKNYLLSALPSSSTSISTSSSTSTLSAQDNGQDYANRLLKNSKKWDKWAAREGVNCYRLYDADLSNYNLAVDRYADWVVMQEYAPPKTVDPHKARQRLLNAMSLTLEVLNLPAERLVLKTRQRQKGRDQYQKLAQQGQFLQVNEYQARLLVNLTDYLDSGLFADHRLVRRLIGQLSEGKDFLNLFGYTASASVHAGLGGARTTTTVDMSRTYLQWAERNLRLNGLTGRNHRLVQADCESFLQQLLAQKTAQFDLIFVDPPTFSNSKRMDASFEVQRDHLALLTRLIPLLRQGGSILFSCNKRGFQLDENALLDSGLKAENLSQKTLSADFARRQNLHHCWRLRQITER